jgi:hypothetical protein
MVQRIHRNYIKATKGICIDVITTTGSVSGRYLAQIKSECLLAEWHIIFVYQPDKESGDFLFDGI